MKKRHWGLVLSFGLIAVMPAILVAVYLWVVADDQYASFAGFTVRQEDSAGASDLLGGLAQLTGSNASSDGDILYEFIKSQSLIQTVEDTVGLREHYSSRWRSDPVFALLEDSSIEELEDYWGRIVRVSFDQSSGLMNVRVLGYTPEKSRNIARQIILEGQKKINVLNEQAREDAMRYARLDLDEAVARLKIAREGLTAFRIRTQIVDPEADLQGRMGVLNTLQQQLAEALIELDILADSASASDPRLVQARRKIDVIRSRIADERKSFATETISSSPGGEDYPSLMAEYEGLVVDREFAEESYRASLAAVDVARAQASRQSRYLVTYVAPTLAETSEYPQRFTIAGLSTVFFLLMWSIGALIYYSVRDRS